MAAEYYLNKIKSDEIYLRNELVRRMRHLADDMIATANRIENGTRLPSELGEIQSRGTIIDAYCGRLTEVARIREEMETIEAEDSK